MVHGSIRSLPTGRVTFLFTDVEGSTRLLRAQGKGYAGLLERHGVILRSAASEGTVFGSAGDALFVAFEDAAAALRAAGRAQQALVNEQWPAEAAVSVRMGVHTGVPEVYAGDYIGIDVHRVARICSAAHGGQVVVSNATRARVAEESGLGELQLVSLGEYRLKDFDAAEPLYQLVGPGLRSEFPPLRTARSQIVSLPQEASSLVGREGEQAWLLAAILDHRIVTIIGPGGVGKSKLAVRTAWHAAPRFDGIVAFVSLAQLDSVDHVPGAIATAIGLDGALGTWDDVTRAFEDQRCLFLIDNAEHLPGLAARLEAWSCASEHVHLLITSRSPTGTPGERTFPLEPLTHGDATQLLTDRIRERQPNFEPTHDQEQVLEAIVARLDGLPLAIELAAARARVLPPAALLTRLDHQMDMLGAPAEDDRQGSMRLTIQWSYDLLSEEPATVFRRLAVFAAPVTLQAAAAVAQRDEIHTLNVLDQLIDASLLRLGGTDDQPRYWMLEPIKQFAHEQLIRAAEAETAAGDMHAWLLAQAESLYPCVGEMLRTLRHDVENINRVLATLAAHNEWPEVLELVELLLDGIVLPLGLFVRFQPLIEQAIAHTSAGGTSQARSDLLHTLFVDNKERAELSEAAYRMATASGEDRLAAHALILLMGDYQAMNDSGRLEHALQRARLLDREGMRLEWGVLAAEARLHFDHEGWDAPYATKMVERIRRSADPLDTVAMLNSFAWTALTYGDPGFAIEPAEEAAQRADDLGLLWYAQVIWHTAAVAALALNRPETARHHLEAAASNMVSCNSGSEANRAILLATAAVLAAHDDNNGAKHLLDALPLEDVRADPDCRWDISAPYLTHVPTTRSREASFASDSIANFALERLEKLPSASLADPE